MTPTLVYQETLDSLEHGEDLEAVRSLMEQHGSQQKQILEFRLTVERCLLLKHSLRRGEDEDVDPAQRQVLLERMAELEQDYADLLVCFIALFDTIISVMLLLIWNLVANILHNLSFFWEGFSIWSFCVWLMFTVLLLQQVCSTRGEHLRSLLEFISAATEELLFFSSKEETELSRDWDPAVVDVDHMAHYLKVK